MLPFFFTNFERTMAKRQNFKRQVGQDGKIRYYKLKKDARGIEVYKQITQKEGAKKFVQKNYDKIKNAPKTSLTKKEQESLNRSRSQRNLFRFDGRPVRKVITDFLKNDQIKLINPNDKELSNQFDRYADLERAFKRLTSSVNELSATSEWGAEGFRNRATAQNIVSIKNQITPWTEQGYEFQVVDGGDVYSGMEAWANIREYETDQFDSYDEENPNLAFLKFTYIIEIDHENNTIMVLLSETIIEPFSSDPIKRTS
jgi:hypothetical protein